MRNIEYLITGTIIDKIRFEIAVEDKIHYHIFNKTRDDIMFYLLDITKNNIGVIIQSNIKYGKY